MPSRKRAIRELPLQNCNNVTAKIVGEGLRALPINYNVYYKGTLWKLTLKIKPNRRF